MAAAIASGPFDGGVRGTYRSPDTATALAPNRFKDFWRD
jgi:hypothetical protein